MRRRNVSLLFDQYGKPIVKNSGYSQFGASRTNPALRGWHVNSLSASEDITNNLEVLRDRSRALYDSGIAFGRGAVERVSLSGLGSGLQLSSRAPASLFDGDEERAAEWSNQVETEFGIWADSKECDINRQMNFYELQNLCFRSVLINGDALVMLPMRRIPNVPYDLKVALIEGDRLHDPDTHRPGVVIDGGVELDETGRPVAYYIANRHPYSSLPWQTVLTYERIPAFGYRSSRRNVLHLFHRERIGQHRGIPFLSPVIETIKQMGRYTHAELMAALSGGSFAVFFEHDINEDVINLEDENENTSGGVDDIDFRETPYGLTAHLDPGVHATTVSPSRPNQQFGAFVDSLTEQIGAALGLPAEVLKQHFTASYSASRAALLEAWKLFSYWRQWWAENFCQPIYQEWLTEAVLKGRVQAPGYLDDPTLAYKYSWAEWSGPTQGQLDPLKEVNAAEMRVQSGFSTRQREAMELTGTDWDLNLAQRAKEEKAMIDAGLKVDSSKIMTENSGEAGGDAGGERS